MAYVQADLDAINTAIKTGASRVELPSVGVVTYRTLDDMLRIQSLIQADVNAAASPAKLPVRRIKIFSTKDL